MLQKSERRLKNNRIVHETGKKYISVERTEQERTPIEAGGCWRAGEMGEQTHETAENQAARQDDKRSRPGQRWSSSPFRDPYLACQAYADGGNVGYSAHLVMEPVC